jgi:hypothetical protein
MTPRRAIRQHCLNCCLGSAYEVQKCQSKDCVLFPYRSGHRGHGQALLSINDKTGNPPHNTRAIIAESRGALHRSASAISKTAPCIYTGSGTIRSAKRRA